MPSSPYGHIHHKVFMMGRNQSYVEFSSLCLGQENTKIVCPSHHVLTLKQSASNSCALLFVSKLWLKVLLVGLWMQSPQLECQFLCRIPIFWGAFGSTQLSLHFLSMSSTHRLFNSYFHFRILFSWMIMTILYFTYVVKLYLVVFLRFSITFFGSVRTEVGKKNYLRSVSLWGYGYFLVGSLESVHNPWLFKQKAERKNFKIGGEVMALSGRDGGRVWYG